jgi:hypothetical protein
MEFLYAFAPLREKSFCAATCTGLRIISRKGAKAQRKALPNQFFPA